MKKIVTIILALCLVVSMTACGTKTSSKTTDATVDKAVTGALTDKLNKGEKPTPAVTPTVETEAPVENTIPVVEEIDMGVAEEIIYLSTLEEGKTYLFHIENSLNMPEEADQEFSLMNAHPQLVNDTAHTVLNIIIQINDAEAENFTAFKHTAYTYVPLANAILNHEDVQTLRLTVQHMEIEDVLDPEQTINLSDCELNETIDMGAKNYLFNNTESTITVQSDTATYMLLPYDILETSFTYVNTIIEINHNEGVG